MNSSSAPRLWPLNEPKRLVTLSSTLRISRDSSAIVCCVSAGVALMCADLVGTDLRADHTVIDMATTDC